MPSTAKFMFQIWGGFNFISIFVFKRTGTLKDDVNFS